MQGRKKHDLEVPSLCNMSIILNKRVMVRRSSDPSEEGKQEGVNESIKYERYFRIKDKNQ